MIDFQKFIKSTSFAIKGIRSMVISENNARIHLLASIVVISTGIYVELSAQEWLWIALAIALVWILEAINTAIEALVDLVSPDFHPLAGKAKDIAAAAVLIASIFAVIVGIIIFFPKLSL
ncbi:diacylglycerol kinase family protein [Arcicella lustrica]|uniref:Diacylglycerol kinase family protein n=1 Tax=Arcicella lustrica TaxID=2984196 RepID=A0ABU5SLA3_9BACT|nr:diacylglycerol kinase family protein [Arcicella sp. DC25W]MEA5428066.1 diacylglycerol kinase family protein [Arcicella sp. DC25W]